MTDPSLYAVTCMFNPCGYRVRAELHKKFAAHMESLGIPLITAEAAIGDQDFFVTSASDPLHVQVRGRSALFLKENLLNLGLKRLSPECQYVMWADDILEFQTRDLKEEIIEALQEHPVVQVFETCEDLDADGKIMKYHKSFAAAYVDGETLFKPSFRPPWTGNLSHTGYCWAARRSVLDACGGFLESCILGSADGLMARAMIGKVKEGIQKGLSDGYRRPILDWERKVLKAMNGGTLGCVKCVIRHNFHGQKCNRNYGSRGQILVKHAFDPSVDLTKNKDGVWEFDSNHPKPKLERDIFKYFLARREDEGCNFDDTPLSPFTPTL